MLTASYEAFQTTFFRKKDYYLRFKDKRLSFLLRTGKYLSKIFVNHNVHELHSNHQFPLTGGFKLTMSLAID